MLTLPQNKIENNNTNININNNTNNNTNTSSYSFPMSQSTKSTPNFLQMNKNMAMLGCQAVARWADSETHLKESVETLSKNHYRAMFQVFFRDTFGIQQTLSIGPIPDEYTTDFTKYTKYALSVLDKKISQIVDPSQLPNLDQINAAIFATLEKYNNQEKLMKIWWCVRGVLANVIESIILVDRVLYLHEKGFSRSTIFPLFNPILSPRSYCIISVK